jgi:hypothetical protein
VKVEVIFRCSENKLESPLARDSSGEFYPPIPPTAEVSFEDSGTIAGVAVTGMGTYTSVIGADGSLHGEGKGLEMTADGEAASWTGTGVGKFGPGGSVSYRGMLFFKTASKKLARLNNACVAFEYDVDSSGSTVSKMWEWK